MNLHKLASICMAILLMFVFCAGCGETTFADKASMQKELEASYWLCNSSKVDESGNVHYKILFFKDSQMIIIDLSRKSDKTLENMFEDMLNEYESTGETADFNKMTDFLALNPKVSGYELKKYNVVYFPEEATVKSVDGLLSLEVKNDNTLVDNIQNSYLKSTDLAYLSAAYDACLIEKKEQQKKEFLKKYDTLPSYSDVKYSPYSYIGRNFIITGRAELDDYFNYDYRNYETFSFCIAVTPVGGGYSDRWYIYGERSRYAELFERLKNGPISNITLICNGYFPDSLKNEMASLIDYYIE
ncbi:MAG: hypothetical protein J6S13_00250 [Clostridia bacterium]|nr:hypothetical protein [Clostridia bacterium]